MIYWSSFFITSKQINIFETVQLVKHTGATNLDKTIFFKYSMGEGEGEGGGGVFSNEIFFHSKKLSGRLTF